MDDDKLEEVLKLLDLQKQALTELAMELMTPSSAWNRARASVEMQKAIIFRAKIERHVRGGRAR